jgi:hypothetical protein
MSPLPSFRRRLAFKPEPVHEPYPWPVDPELGRRVEQTRQQIEHTRRQLRLHVLPDRKRHTSRGRRAATSPRPVQVLSARDSQGGGK